MSEKRPQHDEFLQPVSLSDSSGTALTHKRPIKWGGVLALLLLLWSGAVYVFFREPVPVGGTSKVDPLVVDNEQVVPSENEQPSPPHVSVTAEPKVYQIKSDPAGATVLVNGQMKGMSPLELGELTEGDRIRFQLAGYEATELSVSAAQLRSGVQVSLQVLQGRVNISVLPADSQLFLDGKRIELPATGMLTLPLLPHTFRAEKAGYLSQEKTVTPAQAYERVVSLRLTPVPTATPVRSPGEEPEGLPVVVENSLGMKMIRPDFPLEATLGSMRGTAGRQSNEVIRKVRLTRKFRISQTEVSNAQFRNYQPTHNSGKWKGVDLNAGTLPVVGVRWEDAVKFCNWLSAQEDLPAAYVQTEGKWQFAERPGTGYRLPTESEWEALARHDEGGNLFGWGNEMPPPEGKYNLAGKEMKRQMADFLTTYQDPFAGPAPVTQAGPGPFDIMGLFDNVSEWIHEGYSIPMVSSKVMIDPMSAVNMTYHVIKGASWQDAGISELKTALRRYENSPADDRGFRICRYIE
ncbi:SUMF1/EgtB/PvdO family nonheme iron enzyme [Kiritimatiellota bacterium B12222]|nr:SUMF1/EgtB/PvdO family nonheme iron enzyme [Kiritimatiellota bacterium B12222]